HSSLITVLIVDGGTVSSRRSVINDVVVHQRRRVQKLHHGRHSDRVVPAAFASHSVVGKNGESRPNSFTAGCAKIIADVGDDLDIRACLALEFRFDVAKLSRDQTEYALR